MSMYPYDFQTCGFAIVDDVRAIVESQRDWDFAQSAKDARANCIAAAKRFGINKIVGAELKALSKYLVECRAGLNIATYAWGTYADIKAERTDSLVGTQKLANA